MIKLFKKKWSKVITEIEYSGNEEVVRSIQFVKTSDNKANTDFKSEFHYKIDAKAGLEKGNEGKDTLCKISISHKKPIDYQKWHEEFILIDLVCDLLGLNYEYKNYWNQEQLELFEKYISYISPIPENKYLDAERN